MNPLQTYIGFDHRQFVSYAVLASSIIGAASKPVSITPLCLPTLPIERTGLTPFTFTRFLVPSLQDSGWALFLDSDMLCIGDVAELFALADDKYAAMVVKNPRRFEWASLIMFNCGHPANKALTPEYVADEASPLFKFGWLKEDELGALPSEWNHLVGYDAPRTDAKLVHYTMGIPIFEETSMSEYADEWNQVHQALNSSIPWASLMAQSVHATHMPDGRALPHFHPDVMAMQKMSA
jgi:hypothetical protein